MRVESQQQQGQHHQGHGCQFAAVKISQAVGGLGLAVKHPLDHDQRVDGRAHQSQRGQHGGGNIGLKTTDQQHKLGDKIAQSGNSQRGHGEKQGDSCHLRGLRPEPAHLPHVTAMNSLLYRAGQHKQRGRTEAVGQHLQHRALQRHSVPGVDPKQDKAHMADAAVGYQPL